MLFLYNHVGETQYKQRLEDIRILKLDIKRMRREKNILSKSVANVEDLRWNIVIANEILCNLTFRRELYHVQREILKERTRCKALEEELENPMNIHRWRKLEVSWILIYIIISPTLLQGSDPSTFEMLQKIQTLQRRLIQKTEEVCTFVRDDAYMIIWYVSTGGRKGIIDTRKRKTLYGTKTYLGQATRTRGSWTTSNLPADFKGEDKTNEG